MAATAEARRLTEAHSTAQARIAARTIQAMNLVWPLLDPADVDGTVERWLRATRLVVGNQRRESARLAGNYLATFKTLELGAAVPPPPLVLAETVPLAAVTTSMMVTGPVALRSGVQTARTVEVAQARTAAAAMRHVLNGGRDTIIETVNADRQAKGWARSASSSCCSFCAMLASRGPVFKQGTVDFQAHDACKCGAVPVYRDDAAWPANSQRYRDVWNETTRGLHGQDALNAFRRSLSAA